MDAPRIHRYRLPKSGLILRLRQPIQGSVCMTPRIAWLVLLSLAVGLAYAPQGHGAVPPLALDGVGTCAGGVGCPIQLLTTTKGHDVIVLIVECFCNNEISAIIDS